MTYNHNSTLPEELVEQIAEQGFEYLPELIRIMLNAAMLHIPVKTASESGG